MTDLLDLRSKYRYSISNDGKIYLYEYDFEDSRFNRIYSFDSLSEFQLFISAVGYKRLTQDDWDEEISIPERFHITISLYVRAKAYLEKDDIEKHNYYLSLFEKELRDKIKPNSFVVSQPSEYSLL